MTGLLACVSGLAAALLGASAPAPAPPALIPRALFFGNPEKANAQLSPDGSKLAWLQPDAAGTLQIWVGPRAADAPARQVTKEGRDVRRYLWAFNGDLLFLQDRDGDENYRLFSVRLSDGRVMRLTAVAGIRPGDLQLSPEKPGTVVVVRHQVRRGSSLFGPVAPASDLPEPWSVDVRTGSLSPLDANPGDATAWLVDGQLRPRVRVRAAADGGGALEVRGPAEEPWRPLLRWGLKDSVDPVAVTADGKSLILLDDLGADTIGLTRVDLASGKRVRLASDPTADVGSLDLHPVTRQPRAVSFARARARWQGLDPAAAAELKAIAQVDPGDLELVGGDQADTTWLLMFDRADAPARYYLWDRAQKSATLLLVTRPALEPLSLAPMKPFEIRARDGLSLPSYLTLPPGVEPKGLPTVLLVHGGPWTRDLWGYDGLVQFLASRGYAVLQVNYRGSVGFGKAFKNAALRQFSRRMHDDLVDAVRWAVAKGVADARRVAIMGDSYGGYATLVGLTFTPEVFACGVDLFGPSNLVTLIEGLPASWGPLLASTWHAYAGDPKVAKARTDLEARSPLFKASAIRVPLLIGQGARDPRVPPRESEQMVAAIEKNGGAVTYVVYPNEGHGFTRPENRLDFYARTERFLAACLGGRAEPVPEPPVPGSTPLVREIAAAPPSATAPR